MKHIMCKIAKEILEKQIEQELNNRIKEACLKDKSHTEMLSN